MTTNPAPYIRLTSSKTTFPDLTKLCSSHRPAGELKQEKELWAYIDLRLAFRSSHLYVLGEPYRMTESAFWGVAHLMTSSGMEWLPCQCNRLWLRLFLIHVIKITRTSNRDYSLTITVGMIEMTSWENYFIFKYYDMWSLYKEMVIVLLQRIRLDKPWGGCCDLKW